MVYKLVGRREVEDVETSAPVFDKAFGPFVSHMTSSVFTLNSLSTDLSEGQEKFLLSYQYVGFIWRNIYTTSKTVCLHTYVLFHSTCRENDYKQPCPP